MSILLADKLTKAYGATKALDTFSLSVEAGSFFGLLGPNGAGKSTFMSIVSGFLAQDSGSLSLMGKALDPNDVDQKKQIGFSP